MHAPAAAIRKQPCTRGFGGNRTRTRQRASSLAEKSNPQQLPERRTRIDGQPAPDRQRPHEFVCRKERDDHQEVPTKRRQQRQDSSRPKADEKRHQQNNSSEEADDAEDVSKRARHYSTGLMGRGGGT